MSPCWALLTGEYPPAAGGVADYTAQLAEALAAAGDRVHVFAPGPLHPSAAVRTHPLPGHFGRRARQQIDRELAALPPAQWLIQYVPHAYGRKAMNLGFAAWAARPRTPPPWVMFHEVAVRPGEGGRSRHHLLAWATQRMARQLRHAAARSFVSTLQWGQWLQELAPGSAPSEWLPVPSNLPTDVAPAAVAAARASTGADDGELIGSFSRFDDLTRARLRPLLAALLRRQPQRVALLIGPGGDRLRDELAATAPELRPRLRATGRLDAASAAAHLAAADLLLQPYPDGISGRRGTAMAGLALGRCLLTQAGAATEPLWRSSGAVALAAAADWLPAAEALLADPARRRHLGAAAQQLYRAQFALDHTVRQLRQAAAEGAHA
ncbi:MAG TPA: glycosyltransferase [Terriglobales bacterium]|nr:glycosyltransferase [Terriglobales bacterium]